MKNTILFLVLLISGINAGAEQQQFTEKLILAINQKQESTVRSYCSPGFWERQDGDSGKRFYTQMTHPRSGGIVLKLNAEPKIQGDRGVAVVDIFSEKANRVVDQGYFYLEKINGAWKWGGVDETREHIEPYLAGKVPASFYIKSYKSIPELDTWGTEAAKHYNAAADREGKTAAIQKMVVKERLPKSRDLQLFEKYESITYKTSHYVPGLSRGAVIFEVIDPEYPDYPEEIVVYVEKAGTGWKFLQVTVYPTSSAILE